MGREIHKVVTLSDYQIEAEGKVRVNVLLGGEKLFFKEFTPTYYSGNKLTISRFTKKGEP